MITAGRLAINHRLINFKLSHDFKESLKAADDLEDYDPFGYLTASLVKLKEGEQICYQLLSQPIKSAGNYWFNTEDSTLPVQALKGAIGLTGKAASALPQFHPIRNYWKSSSDYANH